jgi:hypothetical protein
MNYGAAWTPHNIKDYVLFMLFIKYVSDKYADSDDFTPPVIIPQGASFKDMTQLKVKGVWSTFFLESFNS